MIEQIEIPLSKKKLAIMLLGSVCFMTLGIWFIITPPIINNPVLGNPSLIFTVGILAILFFGLCAVFIAKKISDKAPGLIINNHGIIDNSSGFSVGLILWSDISAITTENVHNQKFLILIVKNPEEYIKNQKGIIKRKAMEMNYNTYGSPISISANGLKYNFDELYKIIFRKYNEIKDLNNNGH